MVVVFVKFPEWMKLPVVSSTFGLKKLCMGTKSVWLWCPGFQVPSATCFCSKCLWCSSKKQSGKYRENHFVYTKHFLGQTPHLLDAVMLAKAVASVSWFVWPRVRKITKETSILFGVNCQHLGNGCLLGYRHFGVKGTKLKFDGHLLWNTFVIMLVGVTVWN